MQNFIYAKQIGILNQPGGYYSKNIYSITKAGNNLLISGATSDGLGFSGFFMKTDASGNNFGCETTNVSVTVTTEPAIPKIIPIFTVTVIPPPVNITFSTSNVGFLTENLCGFIEGVNENSYQTSAVEIFPNPSSGKFAIRNANGDIKSIEVYDLQGKIITSLDAGQNNVILFDLSDKPKGVYLVRTIGEKGSAHARIIKE